MQCRVAKLVCYAVAMCVATVDAAASDVVSRDRIETILTDHCYDCHGYGSAEGGLSLEDLVTDSDLAAGRNKWWAVLKNLRAGVMPPQDFDPPSDEQKQQIADWIKSDVFNIDESNPDPGPAVVRRLNRFEYGNTIRDLMGIDFNVEILFPPEDTGFGFDNVGDALTTSPLLLEKYLQAAKAIVDQAVPQTTLEIKTQRFTGRHFREVDGRRNGRRVSFKRPGTFQRVIKINQTGEYRVLVDIMIDGSFDFDPSRCQVEFSIDGEPRHKDQYAWKERFKIPLAFEERFEAGEHAFTFTMEQVVQEGEATEEEDDFADLEGDSDVDCCIESVRIEGPLDPPVYVHPERYQRFFHLDAPPEDPDQRREYAREVIRRFAAKAYRGEPSDRVVQQLTQIAEHGYQQPGATFETGVGQAMAAVLASPRFLFLVNASTEVDESGGRRPLVDETTLAARLSYFLWSTMPDDKLTQLARRGQLRANLDQQVQRMLQDDRANRMIRSFAGQWLRARDVEHVSINPLAALGFQEEWDAIIAEFRRRGFRRRDRDRADHDPETERRIERFRELRELREVFDADVRRAMRRETEMLLEHIVREDRSVLELIDGNYTFLNEDLANYYGVDDVSGDRMRKVNLPEDSPRGGVLAQATMLTVTSNPTRTSPVKRGLFILDNLLGTPSPPPPPDVPELEDAAEKFGDRQPSLREMLALHREADICASCHERMDPLGIALENFNALGQWRETEYDQPIDASGVLISGEQFSDVRDLKRILVSSQKENFYRCMTEKLLTYAMGRGLDYYDVHTVDLIVAELDLSGGKFSVLLDGIIKSAPFQRRRAARSTVAASADVSP